MTALAEPDILTFEPMHVAIELTGTHTAGMTLCDGRRLGPDLRRIATSLPRAEGDEPNAEVAVAVDVGPVLGAVPGHAGDLPVGDLAVDALH